MPDHDTLVIYILAFFGALIALPPLALGLVGWRRKAKDPALPFFTPYMWRQALGWLAMTVVVVNFFIVELKERQIRPMSDLDMLLFAWVLAMAALLCLGTPLTWRQDEYFKSKDPNYEASFSGKLMGGMIVHGFLWTVGLLLVSSFLAFKD